MKLKKYIALILICAAVCVFFAGCKKNDDKDEKAIVTYDMIKNIPDNSCYIEWLNHDYNYANPTVIFVHGEMTGAYDSKVSMKLDTTNYISYSSSSTGYNVAADALLDTIGNKAEKRDLSYFWLRNGNNFNVGIFHYEVFADDDLNTLVEKIFSPVSMRYRTEDGYESTAVPEYSLTEILSAVILKSIPDTAVGREIRLVGNGVGALLALSASDYLYTFYQKGKVPAVKLPSRLAFIDPYLPVDELPSTFLWRGMDTSKGALGLAEDMLKKTTDNGLVAEMIENTEVTSQTIDGTSVEVRTTPYQTEYSEEQMYQKNRIIENTAYLSLTQRYSAVYSANYKKLNRAGVDWYLYSVRGSDGNVGQGNTDKPDYESTYCNWGPFDTRPILNDRQRTNNSSYRGKNYGISAWTPTAWTRALKGIRFELLRYSKTKTDSTGNTVYDSHGLAVYEYTKYVVPAFSSEIYEKAINLYTTIVCGYVFDDRDGDRHMNDGVGTGLGGITVNALLTSTATGETVTVKEFSVKTYSDGFFVLKLDKTNDGRDISFKDSHTLEITVVPSNSRIHFQTAGAPTYFYADLNLQSFELMKKTVNVQSHYSNAITLVNCGVQIK